MLSIGDVAIRGLVVVALALPCPLASLEAQDPLLTAGARLRVTAAGSATPMRTGAFASLTDTTLVLTSGTPIPRASITGLELSRGRKPSIAGGVIGFLLGGAAGGVLACTANRDDYGVFCGGQDDTKLVIGAVVGGAAGAALGALLFRRDRWTPIDLP